MCLCVWGEEAAGQPQSDVAEPRPELSLDTSLVVCVTLDRSLCLSELQPEGSFTNKCNLATSLSCHTLQRLLG